MATKAQGTRTTGSGPGMERFLQDGGPETEPRGLPMLTTSAQTSFTCLRPRQLVLGPFPQRPWIKLFRPRANLPPRGASTHRSAAFLLRGGFRRSDRMMFFCRRWGRAGEKKYCSCKRQELFRPGPKKGRRKTETARIPAIIRVRAIVPAPAEANWKNLYPQIQLKPPGSGLQEEAAEHGRLPATLQNEPERASLRLLSAAQPSACHGLPVYAKVHAQRNRRKIIDTAFLKYKTDEKAYPCVFFDSLFGLVSCGQKR